MEYIKDTSCRPTAVPPSGGNLLYHVEQRYANLLSSGPFLHASQRLLRKTTTSKKYKCTLAQGFTLIVYIRKINKSHSVKLYSTKQCKLFIDDSPPWDGWCCIFFDKSLKPGTRGEMETGDEQTLTQTLIRQPAPEWVFDIIHHRESRFA